MGILSFRRPRQGIFTVSRLSFRCDLQRADGAVIPLGVLSEMMVDGCHIFGMGIRKRVSEDELVLTPASWHEDLEHPEFFDKEFEAAWDTTRVEGGSLDYLAKKHFASLHVLPPQVIDVPDWVQKSTNDDLLEDALSAVLAQLRHGAMEFLHQPTWYDFKQLPEAA